MTADDRSQLRNASNGERFALRKAEERMTALEHELHEQLDAFDEHLSDAEEAIEAEVGKEHWGLSPERPLSWRGAGRDSPRS
jgi:hypothetical protein